MHRSPLFYFIYFRVRFFLVLITSSTGYVKLSQWAFEMESIKVVKIITGKLFGSWGWSETNNSTWTIFVCWNISIVFWYVLLLQVYSSNSSLQGGKQQQYTHFTLQCESGPTGIRYKEKCQLIFLINSKIFILQTEKFLNKRATRRRSLKNFCHISS